MGLLRGFAARLRALARPGDADRDLDDEIRLHLDLETEKNVRLGLPPAEARRRALAAFGGVARVREEHREVRSARWIEETRRDVRIALRALLRSPVASGAAVVTLALGVGANVAIFSAVNAVLLRPLPFASPERLAMLWEENPDRDWHRQTVAPANMLDWRERVPAFRDVAAYADFASPVTLSGQGEPQLLDAVAVTGNLFAVLGVDALHGRTLRDAETWSSEERVVVLSHRAWRERLGGDPAVVGRTIELNGRPARVVGVMPARFAFPNGDVELWTSVRWDPAARSEVYFRRAHWMRAVARLAPGVTREQADAQLQAVAAQLMREHPETNTRMGAGLTPLHEFLVGSTRTPLLVLLGAVAILLLIACVNVGNLLLVNASGRARETAVRLALGAGRGRLVRQALTESLVLAAVGGAAGLALGWLGTRTLAALQPAGLLRVDEFAIDWSVLAFVVLVTTASGLLFGIAPTLWSARRLPAEALRAGGRAASDDRRTRRWGSALVVTEVALALMLTVGAGLLVRSFLTLRQVEPGFDARGVLTASVGLPGARYDTGEKLDAFWTELARRARALPGVRDAALVRQLPLTQPSWSSSFVAAGWPAGRAGMEVLHREVSPGYFRTMRVPLRAGRDFTDADRADATNVVLVNDVLARSWFPGEDPVGQRIAFDDVPDSTSIWRTIVGVVGSERQGGIAGEPRPEIFAPVAQDRSPGMTLVVRARCQPSDDCAPARLAPALRRLIAELDPGLALGAVRTMSDVRAEALARDRFLMTLVLLFAVVGLVLAVVGVYGVLAQLVTRRAREIGIRVALGALPERVRWEVVRHGLGLTAAGLAVGGAASLVATRSLGSLLYRVPTADPRTYGTVALLLVLTCALAAWWPARRASRADPLHVLRDE
jgi:putative ABC transport system permease protein